MTMPAESKPEAANGRPPTSAEPKVVAVPPDDFARLVTNARRGDAAALAALVSQYEPDLRIFARVRLGPPLRPYLDSMDLVQSVHHSLIRGLRQNRFAIAGPNALLALAFALLRHKISRHWRRYQLQKQLLVGGKSNRFPRPRARDENSDPAQTAEYHDQIGHVCRNLDETDRRLIELRCQGCKTPEAARQMGLAPSFLRARLRRLRQRLRKEGLWST